MFSTPTAVVLINQARDVKQISRHHFQENTRDTHIVKLARSFVSSAPFRMTEARSPVAALAAIASISASRTLLLSRFSTANGSDLSLYHTGRRFFATC